MAKYLIYYSITLQGQMTLEADGEQAARDALFEFSDADLAAEAEYYGGQVEIDSIETDAHPLEQLAEQAE